MTNDLMTNDTYLIFMISFALTYTFTKEYIFINTATNQTLTNIPYSSKDWKKKIRIPPKWLSSFVFFMID